MLPRFQHHARETIWTKERVAGIECPQCGTAVRDDSHFCAECGAQLNACPRCRSINVAFGHFCHICGHSIKVAPPPYEITKIVTWETRDFEALDQAVLAIIKLRGGLISLSETGAALSVSPEDIIESIERLELAHQIERA